MKFEWDEEKNKANIRKHRVSFEEAQTVFEDRYAVYHYVSARRATKNEIKLYEEGLQ